MSLMEASYLTHLNNTNTASQGSHFHKAFETQRENLRSSPAPKVSRLSNYSEKEIQSVISWKKEDELWLRIDRERGRDAVTEGHTLAKSYLGGNTWTERKVVEESEIVREVI